VAHHPGNTPSEISMAHNSKLLKSRIVADGGKQGKQCAAVITNSPTLNPRPSPTRKIALSFFPVGFLGHGRDEPRDR